MRTEELHLEAVDGKRLFVRHWAPESDGPARAAVQIAHGMAEHSARYAPVAEALTAAGFLVWASDQRGHGQTAERPAELGHYADHDGWNHVLSDLHVINRHIATRHPDLPRVLLGHSMGSFMAQAYVPTHPGAVDALVLSGSSIGGGALVQAGRYAARLERLRQGKYGRSALLEALSFGAYNKQFAPTRTDFDWLSRDAAQVDAYVADPLCGFRCTNQLWVDFLDGLARLGRQETFQGLPPRLPVYVLAGSEDPVSARTKGLERLLRAYRRAGLTRVTHRFYPGARHEVFNETNRDAVLTDLLGWLDQNV